MILLKGFVLFFCTGIIFAENKIDDVQNFLFSSIIAKNDRGSESGQPHRNKELLDEKSTNGKRSKSETLRNHLYEKLFSDICKKGFSLQEGACVKATWTLWSTWNKCIKTEWGGLQTRERVCMTQGKATPGSCIGRGSRSKTCSDITKEFRIRKNIQQLTEKEVLDLVQAMIRFKKDKTKKGYRNIISWHGWPGRCPWYKNIHLDNHCSWHHHPLFLPWHRLITVQLELGLNQYLKNKTLGIPFWDWTEKQDEIPDLLRLAKIYMPEEKKYVTNPFYRTYIKMVNGTQMFSQRIMWKKGILMYRYLRKGTVRAMLSHDYYHFDKQISDNPHDQIHDCFCYLLSDICSYGMPTVAFASYDPAFLLHHSQMDRLFVMKKKLEEIFGVSDWTKSRVVGQYMKTGNRLSEVVRKSFEWHLNPFSNWSMNPETITRRKDVYTAHKSYYNEQLFGYKYTNYDLGGYPWKTLLRDYKVNNGKQNQYWDDEMFVTKLGILTRKNCMLEPETANGCVMEYSNPL